jgi:hypothetical protein
MGGSKLKSNRPERCSYGRRYEGSIGSLKGVRQVQVNLLCHAKESRCNRDDEASEKGLFPAPHPDKIGIRFAQNDIPHSLLSGSAIWVVDGQDLE